MLLCDLMGRVSAFRRQPSRLGLPGTTRALAVGFEEIAEVSAVIDASPRFVLDDEVVAAATGVVVSRPSSMRDCVAALRVPWRSAWVEWREASRLEARMALGIVDENNKDRPLRLGLLVEAEPSGRSGTVRLAWSHAGEPGVMEEIPAVCPLAMHFDFDRAAAGDGIAPPPREGSDIRERWARSPEEIAAVDEMSRCFWILPTPSGSETVCAVAEEGAVTVKGLLDSAAGDLDGEALSFLAMVMLLTARGAVQDEPQVRAKLNKARARKGEPLLRDHLVVRLRLSAAERRAAAAERAGQGGLRRMHAVRGHFVNRGGNIFWRRAHTRGLGMAPAPTRTVVVSL